MKNFQKIALSLVVGVMAIGFSAFTSVKSNAKFLDRVWANNGTSYVEITSPNINKCSPATDVSCLVQSSSTTIPATFPKANPSHYPVTTYPESNPGVYTP